MKLTIALTLAICSISQSGLAQGPAAPAREAQAPDTLVSPEVRSDRTVVFRVRAPKASEVTVAGEWMEEYPNGRAALVKGADGVWTATVGPLVPNNYLYYFNVDGMTIADPINPTIKLRARTSASLVLVPGGEPWESKEVSHGTVEILWHKSAVLGGADRQVYVYLPPGYGRSTARYPILYLLHGSGDVAAGWTMTGNANFILDNLIAEKKAVPMVVVMTNGHAIPAGAPPDPNRNNNDLFEQYLLKEVMPMVEAKYRIAAGRTNRAITGLSMGGGQTMQIGFGHLDLFAWMGVFSSGNPNLETRFKTIVDNPKVTNERLRLLFIGVGKKDGGYANVKKMSELLTSRGVKNLYFETELAHVWPVWRRCLVETASRLFKNPQ